MDIALSTTLRSGFGEAVERTRDALAEQGFGVLTEIDMKATLKAKLDKDMEDYLITRKLQAAVDSLAGGSA